MAGYSSRRLIKKLGFDRLKSIVVIGAPRGYRDWLRKSSLRLSSRFSKSPALGIHWFVTSRTELEKKFFQINKHLANDGMLWISWPKKTSFLKHDVTEKDVHAAGLRQGLVDVKVAAISPDWSGLKFVYRLKDR